MNVFSLPETPSIFPVFFLKEYLVSTAPLQNDDAKRLFLSLIKPFKCVASQTLARWRIQLKADAGIDIDIFKQHSTHSALPEWIGKTMVDVCGPDLQDCLMVSRIQHF